MVTGRPGATRSESARLAVLEAAARLTEDLGYDRVTIEGIAAAAGVGKPTIYRWYPSKSAIISECLMEGLLLPPAFTIPDTGDIHADLTAWLVDVFTFLRRDNNLRLLGSLLSAAIDNPEITPQMGSRLGAVGPALSARAEGAQARGELAGRIDQHLVEQSILGLIVVRYLGGLTFEDDDARAIVAFVLGTDPGGSAPGSM
jgi:AcrR family transcriptional regulator